MSVRWAYPPSTLSLLSSKLLPQSWGCPRPRNSSIPTSVSELQNFWTSPQTSPKGACPVPAWACSLLIPSLPSCPCPGASLCLARAPPFSVFLTTCVPCSGLPGDPCPPGGGSLGVLIFGVSDPPPEPWAPRARHPATSLVLSGL